MFSLYILDPDPTGMECTWIRIRLIVYVDTKQCTSLVLILMVNRTGHATTCPCFQDTEMLIIALLCTLFVVAIPFRLRP